MLAQAVKNCRRWRAWNVEVRYTMTKFSLRREFHHVGMWTAQRPTTPRSDWIFTIFPSFSFERVEKILYIQLRRLMLPLNR